MGELVKARRATPLGRKPLVTVRQHAFAFNVAFVKQADLEKREHRRVSLYFDDEDRRIGFEFHNRDDDEDSYAVTKDGGQGGKDKRGRAVQATADISKREWVRAVASRDRDRRFAPERDSITGLWVIQLCPAFEEKAAGVGDIPSGTPGLYELLDGNEVVYVGQTTDMKRRVGEHERDDWVFDSIHYSPVEDEGIRIEWESRWLQRYEEKHGRLPRYNKIRGQSPPRGA